MHQYIAFLFTSIFYGTYLIKGLSLKRKGIDANQMAKGEKPRKTFLIELFLASLTYILGISQFVACLIALYNEEFSSKFFIESNEVLLFSGVFFSAVGDIFFIISVIVMSESWRAGIPEKDKTKLVTTGIYKISRNPAFVGFDLFYIGYDLLMPNICIIATSIFAIIVFHLQIMEEEKFLKKTFDNEYVSYMKKTPRYLIF